MTEPVVDARLAEPYATKKEYRGAIERARAAAQAYFAGDELVMDDGDYDSLIARLTATEERSRPGAPTTRRQRRSPPGWRSWATSCIASRC